jgi:hypothetical protein
MRTSDIDDPGKRARIEAAMHKQYPEPPPEPISDDATEDIVQNGAEWVCERFGFVRRTKTGIHGVKPRTGWLVHLYEAERNPILLDILLLHHCGRYMECELKRPKGGVFSPEQKAIIAVGDPRWVTSATSVANFEAKLVAWLEICEKTTNQTEG